MQLAHEKYDDFVDVSGPLLTMSEFQTRRSLPLNEQCAAVFYAKTAHLNDIDFIEIDRDILQMIGFQNTFAQKKDKHGNIKVDEYGNPVLVDKRHDFSNANRCLRNIVGLIEGESFNDLKCHFIIQKAGTLGRGPARGAANAGGAGMNKQSIWIRMRALEHFVIMANTCNSMMIREYFLDLKRIMTEYNMYQAVYRSTLALCIKDTRIDELIMKMDQQNTKIGYACSYPSQRNRQQGC